MPLTVSHLVFGRMRTSETILRVQLTNLGDFCPEIPYFFPKNFKMIHAQ